MAPQRRFLFLQGPHGPFFHGLARMLRAAGAECWRVGFNAGDGAFWPHRQSYIAFTAAAGDWPATCAALLDGRGITDLVLYGDTRPVHAVAVAAAKARGITVHVFEEGYLRPYWITYERGGSNGHSALMAMDLAAIRAAVASRGAADPPPAPAVWGDMREHVFYGALYHFFVLVLNRRYRRLGPHRGISVGREFVLHLRRLVAMPFLALERRLATLGITWGSHPYHLVLLQLAHDASFRHHGPFPDMTSFLETVLAGFRDGAPSHHRLVFKAHPLEDGRAPVRAEIRRLAARDGLGRRVHYVPGGKLAGLLGAARSAVTVNSTAAQQALWRGLPVRCFGAAVYAKPGLVSPQPLAQFFAAAERPDLAAYRDFRAYLLETSQVPGGFYSLRGRRAALRHVVDMMLAAEDPYAAFQSGNASPRQQLRIVRRAAQ